MDNIQNTLLSAFESSGLTYEELAKRTNLPKSALYRYINGDTEKIPIDRFQAICNELLVDAGNLLGWKESENHDTEKYLIDSFRSLSPRGQQLLVERAEELKLLYGKKPESSAAHSL